MLRQVALLFLFLFALLVSLQANFDVNRVQRSPQERAVTLVIYSALPLVAVLAAIAYKTYTEQGLQVPRPALVLGLVVATLILSLAFLDSEAAFELFFVLMGSALVGVLVSRNYHREEIAGACLFLLMGATFVVMTSLMLGVSEQSLKRMAQTVSTVSCIGFLFLLQDKAKEEDVLALFVLCCLFSPLFKP